MTFLQLVVIALIPTLVTALFGFFNHYKLEIIRRDVNGKMDAFLKLAKLSAFAEGQKSERDRSESEGRADDVIKAEEKVERSRMKYERKKKDV